jgi:hypothetical protein
LELPLTTTLSPFSRKPSSFTKSPLMVTWPVITGRERLARLDHQGAGAGAGGVDRQRAGRRRVGDEERPAAPRLRGQGAEGHLDHGGRVGADLPGLDRPLDRGLVDRRRLPDAGRRADAEREGQHRPGQTSRSLDHVVLAFHRRVLRPRTIIDG